MNDYSYISQLTTTLIFLCMCRLVLVNSFYKRTGIIFYLYITVCCLIIAPFSGQLGTPLLLIGASIDWLFSHFIFDIKRFENNQSPAFPTSLVLEHLDGLCHYHSSQFT